MGRPRAREPLLRRRLRSCCGRRRAERPPSRRSEGQRRLGSPPSRGSRVVALRASRPFTALSRSRAVPISSSRATEVRPVPLHATQGGPSLWPAMRKCRNGVQPAHGAHSAKPGPPEAGTGSQRAGVVAGRARDEAEGDACHAAVPKSAPPARRAAPRRLGVSQEPPARSSRPGATSIGKSPSLTRDRSRGSPIRERDRPPLRALVAELSMKARTSRSSPHQQRERLPSTRA